MRIPIPDVGDIGVVKDLPAYRVPLNAWTDANNVRFFDKSVHKALGQSSILTPSVAPYFLMATPAAGQNLWIYAGLAKAYGFVGSLEADVTRASGDYTGGAYDLWNGVMFHGIPVLNNGVDLPQEWNPPGTGQLLVDLTNWDAAWKAKVMRKFKDFLVALDVTKSGTRDRRMVKWSHTADPNLLPTSWDETDPTKDAGEQSLSGGTDALVDSRELGDLNVVYTETQTWRMALSASGTIFSFRRSFDTSGLLSLDCAAEFKKLHFAVTQDDIVVHDGFQAMQSVADKSLRRWFFSNLDSTVFFLTRVVPHNRDREMWVLFSLGGGGLLNTALVWNWYLNTWTIRDLPNVRAAASSLYSPVFVRDLWDDGEAYQWDQESEILWGESLRRMFAETILMSPVDLTGILMRDPSVYQFSGADYTSYVERIGIAAAGFREGQVIIDPEVVKHVQAIWPRITAALGTQITVKIGTQDSPSDAVSWAAPGTFTVGTDEKVDLYQSGKLIAVRFEETGSVNWELHGYDIELASHGLL